MENVEKYVLYKAGRQPPPSPLPPPPHEFSDVYGWMGIIRTRGGITKKTGRKRDIVFTKVERSLFMRCERFRFDGGTHISRLLDDRNSVYYPTRNTW